MSTQDYDLELLHDAAERVIAHRSELPVRSGSYTRTLLQRTSKYELLAICWSPGAKSPIHDHAQSECAMLIADGRFVVDEYRRLDKEGSAGHASLERRETLLLGPGDIERRTGGRDLHRVCAAESKPALTLHLYRVPIDVCLTFESDGYVAERRMRYDARLNLGMRSSF